MTENHNEKRGQVSAEDHSTQWEEDKITKALRWAYPVGLLALLVNVCAWQGILKPEDEDLVVWFQRSGAITVLLAAIYEFKLTLVTEYVNPNGLATLPQVKLNEKYGVPFKIRQYTVLAVAVYGTLVWGYGDIIYRLI